MAQPAFHEIVGGIEDGCVIALAGSNPSTVVAGPAGALGVKRVSTYSGELDAENLKAALAGTATDFPKILIAYTNGVDVADLKTSRMPGKAIWFSHHCTFAAIVASNDPRGEKIRRRGAEASTGQPAVAGTYQMMTLVREVLTGLTFSTLVDEGDDEPKKYMLTFEPLRPLQNEHILRIPNVTAYAVIFKTHFRWISTDRTTAGVQVEELIVDVTSRNERPERETYGTPGVQISAGAGSN